VPLINAIAAGVGGTSTVVSVSTLLILFGVTGWFVIPPEVMNRTVTLLGKDGHALPFAAVIVHTSNGDRHERTNSAGNIVIPRFRTDALTVKDPRYVEATWKRSEIESKLTVSRTVLGSRLDSFADRLLKRARE
jgi:hypothetical protein